MPVETLRLRVASLDDAKRLYDWSVALSPDAPTPWGHPDWYEHLQWLELALGPTDQLIFVGEAIRTDQAIGAVRFDLIGPGRRTVNIVVAPEYRGRGWSRKLLQAGLNHFEDGTVLAQVDLADPAALALFVNAGFAPVSQTSARQLLSLTLKPEA